MQHHTKSIVLTALFGVLAGVLLTGCSGSGSVSDKKIDYIDLNQAVDYYEQRTKEENKALFLDVRKP